MTPPLSIIVTTSGRETRIADMASALATLRDEVCAEWIVGAGGSRREIASILAGTGVDGWTSVMVPVEDSTASRAREAAAARANGEVLLFLDDDFIPMPGCLRAHVEAHGHHADCVWLGNSRWASGCAEYQFQNWLTHRRLVPPAWEGAGLADWTRADPGHWSCPRALVRQRAFSATVEVAGLETVELFSRMATEGVPFRFASAAFAEHAFMESTSAHASRWFRIGEGVRSVRRSQVAWGAHFEARARAESRLRPRWMLSARRWLGLIDGPPEWAARAGHAFLAGLSGRPLPSDVIDEGYPSGT